MISLNPFVLRCEIKGLGDVSTANFQSSYLTVPDLYLEPVLVFWTLSLTGGPISGVLIGVDNIEFS